MKLSVASFALLSGLAPALSVSGEHPIEGVIKLLQKLSDQIKAEGKDEAKTYATFEDWCKESKETLNKAIDEGKENIDSLEDEVSSLEAEEKSLEEKIANLEKEIAKNTVDNTEANSNRKDANTLWKESDQDFSDTIDAVDDAISELNKAEDSQSFVQTQKALRKLVRLPMLLEELSDPQRVQLVASISGTNSTGNSSEPADPMLKDIVKVGNAAGNEKNKYDFKSGNVVDLLTNLKKKFEDDREEATDDETAAANNFDVEKDARDAAITAAEDAKSEFETNLGDVQGDLTESKDSLKNAKDDLEADETTFKDTSTNCKTKAEEWDERCELREHEVEAMAAAEEILAKVADVRTEAPGNPVPPTHPVDLQMKLSFLQLSDPKMKAVNLIRQSAEKAHSKVLEGFATSLAAKLKADDPFEQINNDIQKMIFRLMAEQKDEDEHKDWCDMEIQKSEDNKDHKEERMETLKDKITDGKATSKELDQEIEDAETMITEITEHMQEAKEVRDESKKENEKAIKDSEDAQAAIAKASAVLTSFYKESGEIAKEPYEFLQRDPQELPEEPSSWDASYTGVSDPNNKEGGVLSVLEACASDFAKMEAETRAQEMEDQSAFDEDDQANQIEKARREKEVEMKTQEKETLDTNVQTMQKLRKKVNTQLDAVETYLKDLEPACVDGDSTYEERKEARSSEIKGLKEGQETLQEAFKEESFLQKRSQSFLRRA